MLFLHTFNDTVHQSRGRNMGPDLGLVIPRIIVTPIVIFFFGYFTVAVHRIHYAFNGLVQLSLHCKMVILKTITDYTPLFLQR